jgi:hydrogenase 3 maturation protease
MLNRIKNRLKGKVLVLGIGNTLRNDDAAGSLLARRIKHKVSFEVIEAESAPENYLGKIISLRPDTVVIIDVADFGGRAGEIRILEAKELKNPPLFFTHNAAIPMSINYLQNSLPVDIIVIIIQPKDINFGEKLSPEVCLALDKLESFFVRGTKDVRA